MVFLRYSSPRADGDSRAGVSLPLVSGSINEVNQTGNYRLFICSNSTSDREGLGGESGGRMLVVSFS